MSKIKWNRYHEENMPEVNEIVLMSDGYDVFSGFLDSNLDWRMQNGDSVDENNFDALFWINFPEPPKTNKDYKE